MSQYLFESSLCLFIFYSFYYWQLRKETFFQLNRVYLLITPALSLLIPWLNITLSAGDLATPVDFVFPIIYSAEQVNYAIGQQLMQPTPAFTLTVGDIFLVLYAIGVLLMTWRLGFGLWKLSSLIRRNTKKTEQDCTLIETSEPFPASSFFSYVFWKSEEMSEEKQLILEHEKVHIRQRHSLDVLLIELMVILKWFNPLIYLFRNALKITHEYIADAYMIQKRSNVQQYATLLVNSAKSNFNKNKPPTSQPRFTNSFYSLTKKRLQMMLQKQSSKWQLWKYFAALPLVIILMLLFSFNLSDSLPGGQKLSKVNEYLKDLGGKSVFEIYDDQPEKADNKLVWGSFEIPVEKNAKAGLYFANLIVEEVDFEKNLLEQVYFYENGKPIEVDKIELSLVTKPPRNSLPNNWFEDTPKLKMNFKNYFDKKKAASIFEYVKEGYPDFDFSIDLGKSLEESNRIILKISVIHPNNVWYPSVNLKDFQENEGVFNFQLVNKRNHPTIIKLDTTNAKYRWMYDQYQEDETVKVVHIPDFKTVQRVVTFDDAVFEPENVGTTYMNENLENLNIHQYPDFYDFEGKDIELKWRETKGSISVALSDLKSFQNSKRVVPNLEISNENHEIISATIYISSSKGQAEQWIIQDWKDKRFLQKLQDIPARTSIFFTDILIKSKTGTLQRFPMNFAFNLDHVSKSDFSSEFAVKWNGKKLAKLNRMPLLNNLSISKEEFKQLFAEEPLFYENDQAITLKHYAIKIINSHYVGSQGSTTYSINEFNPFETVKKNIEQNEFPRIAENGTTLILSGIKKDGTRIPSVFLNIGELDISHFPDNNLDWRVFSNQSEVIYSARNPDYQFIIERGKLNEEPKYWFSDGNGTIFHYQNFSLPALLEKLGSSYSKNVELEGFDENEKVGALLESDKHPPTNDPAYFEKLIIEALKNVFQIKEVEVEVEVEKDVYVLEIIDKEKLEAFKMKKEHLSITKNKNRKSKIINDPDYQAFFKSFDVQGFDIFIPYSEPLWKKIGTEFNIMVEYADGFEEEYLLGLDLSSLENLKNQLEKEFGLKLQKERKMVKIRKFTKK